MLDGRSRRRVERYLRSLPEPQMEAIEVVSTDPYEALGDQRLALEQRAEPPTLALAKPLPGLEQAVAGAV